jgi:hypothetical protein
VINGLVNSQTLTLSNFTSGTLASANAGSQALTTNIALGDGTGLASNYTFIQPTLAAVAVTPAPINVTAISGTSVYGASANNPGLSATGLQNGEGVSVLAGISNSFGINSTSGVGSSPYTLNVSGSLSNSNYSVTSTNTGTWAVTPKSLTISGLSGTNKTYDGSTADALSGTAVINGLVNSQTLTLSNFTSGTLANANAGSQALTTNIALGDGTGLASNYTFIQPTLAAVTVTSPIEEVKPAKIINSSSRPLAPANDSAPAMTISSASSAPFSAPDASAGSGSTVFFADPRFDD